MSWDWDDTWQAIIVVLILVVIVSAAALILAPKNVDYYYLGHGSDNRLSSSSCVYAHWTWHADEVAFCTDDKDRALDFVTRANASIVKVK